MGAWGGIVTRPNLFDRLSEAGRVAHVSAPAGSGKTVLLRSWIIGAGLADKAAWVVVPHQQSDAQLFWISVADGLRRTTRVGPLTPAPVFDGWAAVERLLKDLASLDDRRWLVIDDLHELRSGDAMRQLELFLMRSPAALRFVLATRHDLQLGLHRLRLEGELTEIRTSDIRFSLEEARTLFEAAGVKLSDSALALLHRRTEGWAAGLRMAALSLAGRADPDAFAADFSGSERTVAEYLLAEVLGHQPEPVRNLLLRTSLLERVNGPLADVLTGASGSERTLQDLEEANAFVIAVDARRSWFRYHQLFADLLQLELRRSTTPAETRALHGAAAGWFASHSLPIEAIRHAQAAADWQMAADLLLDETLRFYLKGLETTAHELLSAFPKQLTETDAQLGVLWAGAELNQGSLEAAERFLELASRNLASVPDGRRERVQMWMTSTRLFLNSQSARVAAAVEEWERLLSMAAIPDAAVLGMGEELRAFAQIGIGIGELWSFRIEDAERHLEQGIALARRLQLPYVVMWALSHSALVASLRSLAVARERSLEAIELARVHGWSDNPGLGLAHLALGRARMWAGRLDEAQQSLDRADQLLHLGNQPVAALLPLFARGIIEYARGRFDRARESFEAAQRIAGSKAGAAMWTTQVRTFLLPTIARLGNMETVEQVFAEMDEKERDTAQMRIALAGVRLVQGDLEGATVALAPVVDGTVPTGVPALTVQAFLLEARARERLGDAGAADRALERALDLAEPEGFRLQFLLVPAPELLERHSRRRTSHASLVQEIRMLLSGETRPASSTPDRLREPLSESETRVLRYLPTNLSVPEIASEIYLSVNTVKTHIRHLYGKLETHGRRDAVERARQLGLLAPSSRKA